VPLAGGRFVYFHDPLTGRSPKLPTAGPALAEALRPSCAQGLAPRITTELRGFASAYPTAGWDSVIAQLQAAEVI
jgi:hypothetical protein